MSSTKRAVMKGVVALKKKPKSLSFIKLKKRCTVAFREGSFNIILPKSLFYLWEKEVMES
jgi:hypothetical protein